MNRPDPVTGAATPVHRHPLTPLTREEIATAAAAASAELGGGALRFELVELVEAAGTRTARVSAYRHGERGVHRLEVALPEGRIEARREHPDAHPMIQLEEFLEIEDAVKADPAFREALARRGIEAIEDVCVDPWSGGSFGAPDEDGRHVSHGFCWLRLGEADNQYAHPIEGLNPVVDIKTGEVIRVDDHGVSPLPEAPSNYDRRYVTETRDDLRPIDVVQPEGVSFAIEGGVLRWHDWSLVPGFNAREGLTLHDIRIRDRPVLRRASIAEMVVPYGSPAPQHARKNVFDIGEYGLGKLANSLSLGCDCLGAIRYLDGWIAGIDGTPMRIANAVCIHEEDDGIQWKHYDFRTERTEVRRGRRLVISSVSTVGNYEYGSYWYLHLDGRIEFEMKATGIINTAGCEPGAPGPHGVEVMPGVVGQIHQHVFCAKLDLAVDGERCAVVECDTVADPAGPENPFGNAFRLVETPLATEGGRRRAPEAERFWRFESRERVNAMGRPTAFKLEPVHAVAPFVAPDSPSGRRMGFCYEHLWVTPTDPAERFPAGEFVNHSDGSDGLPAWVEKGRPVDGEAITAWHVFGLHHPVRLEDWPVQPVVKTGFKLMPAGFFDRNPTLDLPREANAASCHAQAAE